MDAQVGSEETVKSELAIFPVTQYQSSHLKGQWSYITPINQCLGNVDSNVIIFEIPYFRGVYIDLANSSLIFKVKITKADGTNLQAGVECCFVNFIGAAFFKDIS